MDREAGQHTPITRSRQACMQNLHLVCTVPFLLPLPYYSTRFILRPRTQPVVMFFPYPLCACVLDSRDMYFSLSTVIYNLNDLTRNWFRPSAPKGHAMCSRLPYPDIYGGVHQIVH